MKILHKPLEDFFRNPEKTDFQISDDGTQLAYLSTYERRLNLFVRPLGKGEAKRLTSETDRSIAGFFWGSDDLLLYLKDAGGNENFHLYGIDRQTGEERAYTPFENVRCQIIDTLPDRAGEVLIGLNRRNPQIFDLFRLDIHSGELTLEYENPGNVMSYVTDHEGELRLLIATDGVNNTFLFREKGDDEFSPVHTTNFRETVSPLFFNFDNRSLFASSNLGRDKAAIVLMDPKTFSELEVIYDRHDVDVERLGYSRKRQVITSARYVTWKVFHHHLDAVFEGIYDDLKDQIGEGYEVALVSHDKAESKFVVRSYSDKSLGHYYLYDVAAGQLFELAAVSDWIDEDEMADMRPVTYQTRDDLTIHGYLTVPRGLKAQDLPVVVNPHGGPWVRDVWGYRAEVQFLANRGYAVFQMNYRGSTGYGRRFWESSFKQWGRKMQDDITDGVRWLIEEGIANPERIAIYGGSYGGYATLAGMTFTPELYACGIDYVGVSNLFTFMKTIPPYWEPMLAMMYEMVGHPEEDRDILKAASPVFHVDRIEKPLFIAQGANDPRVNQAESDQIVEALRQRGVEVEYMLKKDEGHGFANEENRFDFYRAMEAFLEEHMNK